MSNNITGDDGISFSSDEEVQQHKDNFDDDQLLQNQLLGSGPASTNDNGSTSQQQESSAKKKKRNLPGTPDPKAEVVALSPTTLMTKNRFICEICSKGFQRDQNLQLHRRGHNLPWKLKQRTTTEVTKRVYICPDPKCVHHDPARALGDLTGIKKHYSRKHGEKKWKCDKCSKKYAVQSDWKAHHKVCGTREYKCDCGTIFSRRDSFITHRAFCDALTQENCRVKAKQGTLGSISMGQDSEAQMPDLMPRTNKTNTSMGSQGFVPIPLIKPMNMTGMFSSTSSGTPFGSSPRSKPSSSSGLHLINSNSGQSGYSFHPDNKVGHNSGSSNMSATALLQKAAQMGATASNSMTQKAIVSSMAGPEQISGPRPKSNMNAFDNFRSPNYQSPLSDMMMYSGMLIGDQNPEESDQNSGIEHVCNNMMGRSPARLGGDAMTTVDFLGVGGAGPQDLHEQIMDLEVKNRRRMQALMRNDDPFHQQDSRY